MKSATFRLLTLAQNCCSQVVSDRAERATIIMTTNLPFSEWTQVFSNVRLCKALLDRVTDRAPHLGNGNRILSIPAHAGETSGTQNGPCGTEIHDKTGNREIDLSADRRL